MTMLALIARRYRAWRRYETVLRELAQLTDRELADIGIIIIVALLWTVGGLFICGVLRQRGGH